MTTSPVTSVTDELIAELEAELAAYENPKGPVRGLNLHGVRALLAEREELKRDAARYRWLRDHYHGFEHYRTMKHRPNAFRDEIDAAMKS